MYIYFLNGFYLSISIHDSQSHGEEKAQEYSHTDTHVMLKSLKTGHNEI